MPFLLVPFVVLVFAFSFIYYFFFLRNSNYPGLQDDWPRILSYQVKERSGAWPSLPPKRLQHITREEFQTLCALCDTILPAFEEEGVDDSVREYLMDLLGDGEENEKDRELLFQTFTKDKTIYTRGALDADVPVRVGEVIETCVLPDGRHIVRMVFKALEMPLGLLFLTGRWYGWGSKGRFSAMPFQTREDVIQRLLVSYVVPIRGVSGNRECVCVCISVCVCLCVCMLISFCECVEYEGWPKKKEHDANPHSFTSQHIQINK